MFDFQHKYIFEEHEILFDFKTYSIHPSDTPIDIWERLQKEEEFQFLYRGVCVCHDYEKITSMDSTDGIAAYNEWINK